MFGIRPGSFDHSVASSVPDQEATWRRARLSGTPAKTSRPRGLARSLAASLFFALALAGCDDLNLSLVDLDQTITVYRGEEWEAGMVIRLPPETIELIGSEAEARAMIEGELASEYGATLQESGIQMDWKSETDEFGELVYTFNLHGAGLDSLKAAMLDEDSRLVAAIVDGQRQIVLSHYPGFQGLFLRNYSLTLTGGRILSSNGQLIDEHTVQWIDPSGRIEAVFTEKARFDPIRILLPVLCAAGIAILAAMVVFAVIWFARRRAQA